MSDLRERLLASCKVTIGYKQTKTVFRNPDGPEASARIEALEAERNRLREGIEKAAERLEASRFTNAEHKQAADILRAALAGGE